MYSATGGVQPTPTDLEYGELAINIADGKVYFRGDDDSLKTVTSGDYVESFNAATGAVEGVSSVNGQTGGVVTGFRYKVYKNTTFIPTSGLTAGIFSIYNPGNLGAAYVPYLYPRSLDNEDWHYLAFHSTSTGRSRSDGEPSGTLIVRDDSGTIISIMSNDFSTKIGGGPEYWGGQTYDGTSDSYLSGDDAFGDINTSNQLYNLLSNDDIVYLEWIPHDPVPSRVFSVNGLTGDVEGVSSFNGATGAVEGVSSFNGATGDVNLSVGYEYEFYSTVSTPTSAGKFSILTVGSDPFLSIHETTNDSVNIQSVFDDLSDRGGDITILKSDGTEVLVAKDVSYSGYGSNVFTYQLSEVSFPVAGADPSVVINTALTVGDIAYLRINPYPNNYVKTFNGATGAVQGVSSVNGQTGGVTAGYIHIGATAPASPTEMDFWFETDTGSFYAYIDEGGGAAWVEISADPAVAVTSVNGATGDVIVVSSVNGVTGAVSISSFVSGSTGTTTDSIFYDSASSSFINNTNLQLTPTGIPFLTQFGETIYDWGGVTTGATFEIDLSNGMIQHINVGPTGGTGDGSTKTFSFTGENGSLVENVMLVIRGGAGYTMDFTNVTWNDEAGEPAFGVTSGTWTFVPFTYIPIDGLGWVGGAQMTVVQ